MKSSKTISKIDDFMENEKPNEHLEKCVKAFQEFGEKVKEIVASIIKAINKAFSFLADDKPKYQRLVQKTRPLYLDKRRKIYRCRNNC